MDAQYDVIVVGAGNAAMCAALAAHQQSAKVVVLERAPHDKRGGNSAFTGGGFRLVYHGVDTIKTIVPDITLEQIETSDFGEYSREQYLDDLGRITQYNIDPDLAETLATQSTPTVQWMQRNGVRFELKYGRQAYKHDGRFKFWGGLVIQVAGGGRRLMDTQFKIAQKQGIQIRYNAHAVSLLRTRTRITGVRVMQDGVEEDLHARAVVLACGGFEANREWRTRYLGPGWDLAKVRGTRYNTGDGIRMALDIGAQPYGQWSGCHSTSWERHAPDFGYIDEHMSHTSGERHCYQFGIMVNSEGKRFLDEGADFRNFTYAKYGRIVLQQPGNFAWQVFDAQGTPYLRNEYRARETTKVRADTLEGLVKAMNDVAPAQFLQTVREYNAAVKRSVPFDPNIKDGRCTQGLAINKSNWANPLEVPPFEAYSVGTGITFTFGGLKIDPTTRVLDIKDDPLPGLYAAGELVGGIFYFNYPGASGLMSGAVFGHIAGREAASYAQTVQ